MSYHLAAELVYQGFDLRDVGEAKIVDFTTTCPVCGHGEATIDGPAEPCGFIETCCNCDHTFVDLTP
jgi:hypothetical protein